MFGFLFSRFFACIGLGISRNFSRLHLRLTVKVHVVFLVEMETADSGDGAFSFLETWRGSEGRAISFRLRRRHPLSSLVLSVQTAE